MGEVEYLPATEHDDGIMGVDLSDCENRDNVCASVDSVARYWKKKNKELRVKIPREYFNSLWSLGQMGFNRIERSDEAYIVVRERDDESQKAWNVLTTLADCSPGLCVLKERELDDDDFFKKMNDLKTLTNRSYGPRRALLRREIAAVKRLPDLFLPRKEQGSELQPFPLDTTGMGHDYKAAGLQDFSAGSKIPEYGVQTKKRPPPANKSERPPRRIRGPDFEDEDKGSLLQVMLEYLQDPANEGKPHKWLMPVTEIMKDKGCDLEAPAWRGLWETLVKNHDALMRNFAQGIGYWDLTEVQKKTFKKADSDFPLTFEREWVDLMANIWNLKPRRAARKQSRRDGQEGVFSQALAATVIDPTNLTGAGPSDANIQALEQHPGQTSARGSDEHPLVNPHRLGTSPSPISWEELFASFGSDFQEFYSTMDEQLAVQHEEVQLISSSMAGVDQAGINELENE